MIKVLLTGLFLAFAATLYSQSFDIKVNINLKDEYQANKTHKLEFYIENVLSDDMELIDYIIMSDNEYIIDNDYWFSKLKPNETILQSLKINIPHNIQYNYVAFIKAKYKNNLLYFPVIYDLKSVFENEYYDETYNLFGEELKNKLKDIVSNGESLSYLEAAKSVWKFDYIINYVECIYTGNNVELSFPIDFAELEEKGFNTAHIWPRSKGASKEPELSDMFNIFPSTVISNEMRSDIEFGNVTQSVSWEEGGSQLGLDDGSNERFEVRDDNKGKIARSMLYFALRYATPNNYLNYLANQEDVLRNWSNNYPVDGFESRRNDSIYKYQHNRNPFIDYPQFLERIYSFTKDDDLPTFIDYQLINKEMHFSFNEIDSSEITIPFFIYNSGNKDLIITEFRQITKNIMPVSFDIKLPDTIGPGRTLKINATAKRSYDNYAEYEIEDETGKIHLLKVSIEPTTGVSDISSRDIIAYNYPNPFELETTIFIDTEIQDDISIIITDILGNSIHISDDFGYSNGSVTFIFNPSGLFGNTFYYNISHNGKIIANGLMLKK